jgi:hypothetical protein
VRLQMAILPPLQLIRAAINSDSLNRHGEA